jgi:hypothetical protein
VIDEQSKAVELVEECIAAYTASTAAALAFKTCLDKRKPGDPAGEEVALRREWDYARFRWHEAERRLLDYITEEGERRK